MVFARNNRWVLLLLFLLTACSGGGETGTGLNDAGKGNTADGNSIDGGNRLLVIGALSNISSSAVVVNGNTYGTGVSSIVVGNTSGSESDLAVGMVVAIDASVDEPVNNGSTNQGTASVIVFENEVEGIVLANDYPNSLDVMGQVVLVNNDTVFESHVSNVASIKDIRKKDHVEISGYPTNDGAIYATHVVVKSDIDTDNQIVVKGKITALSTVDHQFKLGNLTVSYLDTSLSGGLSQLNDGMSVRLIGHMGFKGNNNEVLFAEQILPLINSGFQFEGTQIEIEGIAATDLLVDEFVMCRISVLVNDVTSVIGGDLAAIKRGRKLKVSGVIDSHGRLVADTIVFMRQSTITLKGRIEAVDSMNDTVEVFGKTVHINSNTSMRRDDDHSNGELFNLSFVSVGDFIEIKTYRDSITMNYVATRIETKQSSSTQIMGQIDDIQNNSLIMKSFVIDISSLPPGQFKSVDIGRRVALTLNYSPVEQSLIATDYEFDD